MFIIVITLEKFVLLQDRLGLSRLREGKFKNSFQDMLNPLCSCSNDVDPTEHSHFYCPQFVNERRSLLSTLGNFNYSLLENTSNVLTQTFAFRNYVLVQAIAPKFLMLHMILSYQLKDMTNSK